jgi:hypothetical protein
VTDNDKIAGIIFQAYFITNINDIKIKAGMVVNICNPNYSREK